MGFAQYAANTVLQVTLIVLAITLFFFLYASHIEEKVVVTQIDRLVNSFTGDMTVLLKPDEKRAIQQVMKNMSPTEDMTKADADARESNQQLINKSSLVVGAFMVIGIFVSILLGIHYKLDFWNMVKSSIVGVLACMFTEYMFLTYLAANYHSLDPNNIKRAVIQSLQDYSNS